MNTRRAVEILENQEADRMQEAMDFLSSQPEPKGEIISAEVATSVLTAPGEVFVVLELKTLPEKGG